MHLSILIPTHNRPELFDRCLKSVLSQMTNDVEIIVNNDSNDITEIAHPAVKYFYNKFDNLSLIYKFLLDNAQGNYVYFLEDDDYLSGNFLTIPLDADIIAGNYSPTYKPNNIMEYLTIFSNDIVTKDKFIENLNLEHLQLSQFIFRKKIIENFKFPMDNNVHNDINLVMYAATNSNVIKTHRKIFFYQTTDGGDNISFPHTTPTINISKSLDFLDQYK